MEAEQGPAKRQKTASVAYEQAHWQTLETSLAELDLDLTLPTGQSFRWRPLAPREYVGVLGQRAVRGTACLLLRWPGLGSQHRS